MFAKVAFFCLLAQAVQAVPKPEADPQFYQRPARIGPGRIGVRVPPPLPHPDCKVETETKTIEHCRVVPEKLCETTDFKTIEVTHEKQCEEVVVEQCQPAFLKKREADPQLFPGRHPLDHPRFYQDLAVDCRNVTRERCTLVPSQNEVTEPIERCRVEPKKECEEKEVEVEKLVCPEPKEVETKLIDHPFYGPIRVPVEGTDETEMSEDITEY